MWRRCFGLARPVLSVGAAAVATTVGARHRAFVQCEQHRPISPEVHLKLLKLRAGEAEMRRKWEEDESGWHNLPPRAWPPVQPKPDELVGLKQRAAASDAPVQARFDLATCLTFNNIDSEEGLLLFRELAAEGSVDASVAVGVVLLEGIGCEQSDAGVEEGVRRLRAASAKGHAQAQYEIGVLHYLGSFPTLVAENTKEAYALFASAADQKHTSALFMCAELLISGDGCTRDEPRAIGLLHDAAERGHRMARQYVREYLDADASQWGGTAQQRAQQHAERLPSLPAQGSQHFAIFRADGREVGIGELLDAAAASDVVLVGECHDDPVAHSLELYLVTALAARCPDVVLSLEMFERDVQTVIDEYLAGLVREEDMLHDARPWANFESDYRPLLTFAKQCTIPVLAANAPRRYVGAVGRDAATLRQQPWPAAAYATVAPLPLPPPTPAYTKHLLDDPAVVRIDQLGISVDAAADSQPRTRGPAGSAGALEGVDKVDKGVEGSHGGGTCPFIGLERRHGLLEPMVLWDATMAHTIAQALAAAPQRLVVHVCGSFHVERGVGIGEMLRHYRAAAKQLVVGIYPEVDCHHFDTSRHGGLADFIILTDASLPRSHDYHGT